MASDADRYDRFNLYLSAVVQLAARDDGPCRTMCAKERRIGAICFVPVRDVGHVNGASDDVINVCAHNAADGCDVAERKRHLIGDADVFGIGRFAGYAELS